MTFMIILGTAAGLYLIILMLRLASIALPLYAGIGAGLWMLGSGYGHLTAIVAGLLLAIFILVTGRLLCAMLPPFYRGLVALAFALPAGFAGYQAAKGLGGLAVTDNPTLEWFGFLGALTAAVAAWRRLGTPHDESPAPYALRAVS